VTARVRLQTLGLPLLAGALAALAHPPFGFLPGLLGYGLLMILAGQAGPDRPLRAAFLQGWLAGVAYFAIGVWWVAEAFLVDIAAHGWMAPLAVTFLAGGVSLFWGTATTLFRWAGVSSAWRVLVFAGALSMMEWLRGHILTGFPWNLPGETWRAGSLVSQSASLVGAYGLTFLTIALAATPALLWRGDRRLETSRPVVVALSIALVLLAGMAGFGAWRLSGARPADPAGPLIRIVQPYVPQEAKYDPQRFAQILDSYLSLTAAPAARRPAIVVWPEGAVPALSNAYLAPGTWTRAAILQALTPGQVLITGAARSESLAASEVYFNSLIVLRRTPNDLEQLGAYDKHRLVPFGEYLPMDGLLTPLGIHNLVQIGDGFAAGPPPRPLVLPGLPVIQPLICYESLYPGFTRAGARASGRAPDLIINVSNDAWFGATTGPLQHLNLASYRAIEEGVPMVRATPTGVSAMIDPFGRPVPGQSLGQGGRGVVDARLPRRLAPTGYRLWGEWPFLMFLCLSAGLAWFFGLVERRNLDQITPRG
jgi:apolipoprotein N-acyltransferase